MTSKFGSDLFIDRHLGLGDNDARIMLNKLGFNDIDQFINQVIPEDIQLKDKSSKILALIKFEFPFFIRSTKSLKSIFQF